MYGSELQAQLILVPYPLVLLLPEKPLSNIASCQALFACLLTGIYIFLNLMQLTSDGPI